MAVSKLIMVNRTTELYEELRKLISYVQAQTSMISGEGLENFCNHSDQIKSDYLWSISDAAERALTLIDHASGA